MELFSKTANTKIFGQAIVKMAKNQPQLKKRTIKQPEVRPICHKMANLPTMGVGRGSLYFGILHFSIAFLAKKSFSLFREGKTKFHHFGPPGNIFEATSGKIQYRPPLEKNPSDAHDGNPVQQSRAAKCLLL